MSQNNASNETGLYPINSAEKMPDRIKSEPGFAFPYRGSASTVSGSPFKRGTYKFVTSDHVVMSTSKSRFCRSVIVRPRKNTLK